MSRTAQLSSESLQPMIDAAALLNTLYEALDKKGLYKLNNALLKLAIDAANTDLVEKYGNNEDYGVNKGWEPVTAERLNMILPLVYDALDDGPTKNEVRYLIRDLPRDPVNTAPAAKPRTNFPGPRC